jgi:hypothetical protein
MAYSSHQYQTQLGSSVTVGEVEDNSIIKVRRDLEKQIKNPALSRVDEGRLSLSKTDDGGVELHHQNSGHTQAQNKCQAQERISFFVDFLLHDDLLTASSIIAL